MKQSTWNKYENLIFPRLDALTSCVMRKNYDFENYKTKLILHLSFPFFSFIWLVNNKNNS